MSKLSKNNLRDCIFTILIIISAINMLFSQEKDITFTFQKNPMNTNYWWLEKNNFGREVSKFGFESRIKYKKSKTTYMVNFFSDFKNNNLEKIYINESFVKHDFSENTFIRFGRYYRDFSKYLNDELSSGSMLISQNAQPMPKIGLLTSYVIKKNNNIRFDFGIAHGSFNKNDIYKKEPLLHEKFLYMNIIKNDYKLSLGFVHEAMWGGNITYAGNQPRTISNFLKVFISQDGPLDFPHANALGNHLGIWDFYLEKKNNDKILKLYYQHLFEDTSGLRFANKTDGLWGVELIDFLQNTTILIEYINTKNQFIDYPYVHEKYYNHGLYGSGWSYKNYTLGNPFIDHLKATDIAVLHLGMKGDFSNSYNYTIKVSRRIDFVDQLKYKLSFSKIINNQNQIEIFIVNNNSANGLGVSISKNL